MTTTNTVVATPETAQQRISRLMRANKSEDTKPELFLRKALWNLGIRGYRLHRKELPGRPDVSFPSKKLAVFVHGCFWHQCPHCEGKKPRSNTEYWQKKFAYNAARDTRAQEKLSELGWRAVVLWECEIRRDANASAKRIVAELSFKA